ncbi:LOW QUALITY PROTEIN: MP domain-containing protein, partial [Cephalotus follicularis]
GLNSSFLACLRDAKHLNFDDSLIGAIETSLCNGPVYFDEYPDLSISLTNTNILENLKSNIKFHGYNINQLPPIKIESLTSYYHRLTYPDLQIEERGKFVQASYQSGTTYGNIDGMNEYHIINKLQEMTMVSNAYKTGNASDKVVDNMLIAGFTGQLKGWWDNVLTVQQQTDILESIQINEIGESMKPILNLDNEPIEDAAAILIYNITKYFIGDHTYLKDRTTDQLNFRCRKLQDFRGYKDTCMTNVLTGKDA